MFILGNLALALFIAIVVIFHGPKFAEVVDDFGHALSFLVHGLLNLNIFPLNNLINLLIGQFFSTFSCFFDHDLIRRSINTPSKFLNFIIFLISHGKYAIIASDIDGGWKIHFIFLILAALRWFYILWFFLMKFRY